MNPYAAQLAGRDPMPVIAATAGQLDALLRTLGPDRVERPRAPGKWSPREIACHLADCEIVFSYRLRQALAEARHVVQP
ncbi:MAG: DinB family protein, partial [Terriglobales bacterium]